MKKPSSWELWSLSFGTTLSVLQEVEPTMRTHGLETKEFFLLEKLDLHPYPGDLARALVTPKATITFLVKRLEAAGYVVRETEAGDLRRFRLTMTRAGRKAMEASRTAMDEAFGRRLARISASERAELARILQQMATSDLRDE